MPSTKKKTNETSISWLTLSIRSIQMNFKIVWNSSFFFLFGHFSMFWWRDSYPLVISFHSHFSAKCFFFFFCGTKLCQIRFDDRNDFLFFSLFFCFKWEEKKNKIKEQTEGEMYGATTFNWKHFLHFYYSFFVEFSAAVIFINVKSQQKWEKK